MLKDAQRASRIQLTTENVTPIVIEGVAIDGGDQACGNTGTGGNLMQPSISRFQCERDRLHFDALVPPQGNGTGQRIVLEVDDIPGQSRAAFPVALFVLLTSRAQCSLSHAEEMSTWML
jgi:hypothetical protein